MTDRVLGIAHHISICISTYKRPLLLERLLHKIFILRTDGLFSYSVVVVDNDALESAREVALKAMSHAPYEIHYYVEPEKNISLARNLLVKNSTGDMVAFIDDDEFPDENWLLLHYSAILDSEADGVLGPVLPHFDSTPPPWLSKSGLLDRKRFRTKTKLTEPRYTRTGNVLLFRDVFRADEKPFDPAYGRSGGEDAVFFGRKIREGKSFIWCDEACVYETVPIERQRVSYHIKRAFVRGLTSSWTSPFFSIGTMISIGAVLFYTLILPCSLILGYHATVKFLVKDCDHAAKLLAYAGIRLATDWPS